MRSMLVRLGPKGDVLATHDVTPAAMGAAAPTFMRGNELALITADPRNGLSPIARTPLDLEGKPGTAEVAAPVGMMSQPPQLSAAQVDGGIARPLGHQQEAAIVGTERLHRMRLLERDLEEFVGGIEVVEPSL